MPRLAEKGEHRNNHQLGTAEKFAIYKQIRFVNTAGELNDAITASLRDQQDAESGCPQTSVKLIERLKSFVNEV